MRHGLDRIREVLEEQIDYPSIQVDWNRLNGKSYSAQTVNKN